jgi:hypothetical protein
LHNPLQKLNFQNNYKKRPRLVLSKRGLFLDLRHCSSKKEGVKTFVLATNKWFKKDEFSTLCGKYLCFYNNNQQN